MNTDVLVEKTTTFYEFTIHGINRLNWYIFMPAACIIVVTIALMIF